MSSFIDKLRNCKSDRGMMANLRCGLIDNRKHRAWPVLSRLGIGIDNETAVFVAALYASHPEEAKNGNFGQTCRQLEAARRESKADSKMTPTERRFQLVVAAGRHEVKQQVLRMVLMAKAHNIPVNYSQLETDLRFWNERTRTEWAREFWAPGSDAMEVSE